MNKFRKLGFIAIETVIVGALIMTVGLGAVAVLGGSGGALMQGGLDKLEATGVFGSNNESNYDANGYDKSLNVQLSDINPMSDFSFSNLGSS